MGLNIGYLKQVHPLPYCQFQKYKDSFEEVISMVWCAVLLENDQVYVSVAITQHTIIRFLLEQYT